MRQMKVEGLILQGCNNNLQKQVDSINEMLTRANVLLDGSKFENVMSFQREGITYLLFPFAGIKLNANKLETWRLQTYSQFGGAWLSAYVFNYLGGFSMEAKQQRPHLPLRAYNDRVTNLMCQTSKELKKAEMVDEAMEMCKKITGGRCNDYFAALDIINEYVEAAMEINSPSHYKKSKKEKYAHER